MSEKVIYNITWHTVTVKFVPPESKEVAKIKFVVDLAITIVALVMRSGRIEHSSIIKLPSSYLSFSSLADLFCMPFYQFEI